MFARPSLLDPDGFLGAVDDALLDHAAGDRPAEHCGIDGLVLLRGQLADVGDRGRVAGRLAVDRRPARSA